MTLKKYFLAAGLTSAFMNPAAWAFSDDHAQTFYLGTLGGLNFVSHSKVLNYLKLDMGYTLGANLGYQYGRHFRTDVSIDYTRNGIKHTSTEVSQSHFLLNGYFDIPTDNLILYMGAGLGYAFVDYYHLNNDVEHKYYQNGFGWKLAAGVKYRVSDSLDLGLGYRLLGASVDNKDQLSGAILNESMLVNLDYHFRGL